jgi:hypothetical protein
MEMEPEMKVPVKETHIIHPAGHRIYFEGLSYTRRRKWGFLLKVKRATSAL